MDPEETKLKVGAAVEDRDREGGRPLRAGRTGRFLLAVSVTALAWVLMAGGASAAAADTLGISISSPNAVSGIPLTITFTGTSTPYDQGGDTPYLYAVARPASGGGCQPTFGADQQVTQSDNPTSLYDGGYNDDVQDGDYSYTASFTPKAGSYIVCAWLETTDEDSSDTSYTAAQIVTAVASSSLTAANTDTLSVGLSTSSPQNGKPFTLTFSGADTPFDTSGDTPYLYAVVRRASGGGCQPTFGADQQVTQSDNPTSLYDGGYNDDVQDGDYSYTASFTPKAGSYIVCAWLETTDEDSSDTSYTAAQIVTAVASTAFTVPAAIAKKVECVVPDYAHKTLETVERRLRANHCAVGVITHRRDRRVKRGEVVRISATPGKKYKSGTKIWIEVSKG